MIIYEKMFQVFILGREKCPFRQQQQMCDDDFSIRIFYTHNFVYVNENEKQVIKMSSALMALCEHTYDLCVFFWRIYEFSVVKRDEKSSSS